jgi:hypothetical protein
MSRPCISVQLTAQFLAKCGRRQPITTPTLDQVVDLAHQLPRAQRGQLIALLALELATETPPTRPPLTPDQARAALDEIRKALAALPQPRLALGEQLEADRRDRELAILGRHADMVDDGQD